MVSFDLEPIEALEAIKARINGVYDNPSLLKIGFLSNSITDDIKRIVNGTLRRKATTQ